MQLEPHHVWSIERLLALPYFDLLSALGEFSLHPGGLESTAKVLNAARVLPGSKILEVGCGTGASTGVLLRAGLDVTVAEPNPSMIAAMERNCLRNAGRSPRIYQTSAEQLDSLPGDTFDVVLYEAVFGFITDRVRALSRAREVLLRNGQLALIDFHYVRRPSDAVLQRVATVVGHPIDVLFESDWRTLLRDWTPILWEAVPLAPLVEKTSTAIQASIAQSKLEAYFAPLADADYKKIADKLRSFSEAFEPNRDAMRAHHIVVRAM